MDYFSVVEVSILVKRLDYRLRLHNYQLSQWCLMNDEDKRKHANTLQLFKLLPYDELLKCTQKEMGFMNLRESFKKLVSGQLANYSRMIAQLKELLAELSETELNDFKKAHKVGIMLCRLRPWNSSTFQCPCRKTTSC